jgi:hypothetical protein
MWGADPALLGHVFRQEKFHLPGQEGDKETKKMRERFLLFL